MRVLVTGGSGLVGRAIQELVASDKAESDTEWTFVASADCDLLDATQVNRLFTAQRPTHVLHLAAQVGGLYANLADNAGFWRTNLLMNQHVLDACVATGVKKFVGCLSTCVFPDTVRYPMTEADIHGGPPHSSNEGYSYAKRMLDVACRLYSAQYSGLYTTVVPTNIYGKHDNFSMQSGHVIPGLIHKCHQAKLAGEPFTVWGSGTPVRQFIYARDLARLMIWAVRSYSEPEPIILCGDQECSIAEVAREVAQALEFRGSVQMDTSKADGQFRKTASNAKLQGLLPEFKFTPLAEGLQETIEWFTANYDTARK